MWPAAMRIVVGSRMRRSHVLTGLGLHVRGVPAAEEQQPGRHERRVDAVLASELRERGVPVAEPSALAFGAGELDRRRKEHRVDLVEPGARRCHGQHGARAVRRLPVQQVVVDLHHDRAAGLERDPGSVREPPALAAGRPRRDPVGVVQRLGRAGEPGPAEARPAWPAIGCVELRRLGAAARRDPVEDHVVDDLRGPGLDARRGHRHVVCELRVEDEAAVVVGGAGLRGRHVRSRHRDVDHTLAVVDRRRLRRTRLPRRPVGLPARLRPRRRASPALSPRASACPRRRTRASAVPEARAA